MKTEVLPYRRLSSLGSELAKTKGKKIFSSVFTRNTAILVPLAFLFGRASFAGGIMPFGIVLYAASIGMEVNRLFLAISIIAGMITNGAVDQIYITASGMFLFNALNIPFKNMKSRENVRYAITGFVSILIPEMVVGYLQGFLLYDLLRSLLESFIVFSLMFVFRNALPVICDIKRKSVFTNEEMISTAIFTAIAVSGMASTSILGFNIKNILCILIILMCSYKYGSGVGSAIGVTVGLIVSMNSTATPLVIASYAFCGLLSGIFKSLGKVGASLGFIMGNAIMTLYINGSMDILIYLKEIILAVIIFMLVPKRFIMSFVGFFDRSFESNGEKISYSSRMKEITVEKLNKFSRTFKELAKTFGEISEISVTTEKQDITSLFDRVADHVCKDCSLCLHCWDRNFYNTYLIMFKVFERLDAKGRIESSDIPEYFIERCERVNDFVKAVNNVYEIYKVDMAWKNKVGESRELVSQQLEGLSKIVSNLASEINMDIHFRANIEDAVVAVLNKAGIKVTDAIVFENKWGKYEISIFHKGCGGKRLCVSTIEKLVSEVTGRKIVKENSDCCQKTRNSLCILKLVEEETFRITTGVSKIPKNENAPSGDSYTFMNTGDGKYIIAISDGMGSGQRASNHSRATISLLEQFMESGFDKDTTVKLINSILVLKSDEEAFSTIDMSVIDLYEGEIEFVKIGASPTFIKKEERVETVKSATLPAGLLNNIEMELIHKKANNGDFIIMTSDGILDAFNKAEKSEKDLADFIQELETTNPQDIADSILNEAFRLCEGTPVDDMIVLASKVWKNVG
ncbi:MAG TPA: stage II sporulation protein E [Clostridia bacterium]|nr:stage II sporulation protein E [Clostridia bacterium]